MGGYSKKVLICTRCNREHYRWGKFCGTCYNQQLKRESESYRKCLYIYGQKRNAKREKKIQRKICINCIQEFLVSGKGSGFRKYCDKCKKDIKRKNVPLEKNCVICGKLFVRNRHYSKHILCSKGCQRRYSYQNRDINKRRQYNRNREAQEKGAIGSHTFQQWEELKKKYNYMCLCCKIFEPEIKLERDHITPISRGGDNNIGNIQPLCRSCNAIKHNKIIRYEI